ncbi:MAG: glycosyltransferase family 2 protein [Armatimonadota bacterium]
MAKRISAIIPAYNEADIIYNTVSAVLKIPGVTQVIVVDDASTDDTARVAEEAGASIVIRLYTNSGKGGALNAGFNRADGDIILLLDADLGESAFEGYKLLKPVLDEEADMTIGQFNKSAKISSEKLSTGSKGFGTVVKITRFGIKILTGRNITAPLSGQRAIKREIIEEMGSFPSGFAVEAGMTIDVIRMGRCVLEVPVNMGHRASGRDLRGFLHRGKQMLDVLKVLVFKAIRR